MKSTGIGILLWVVLAAGVLVQFGCDITTKPQPPPPVSTVDHPVINEIFVLPSSNQNHFNWIELYNPTGRSYSMSGWSLTMSLQGSVAVFDTAGNVRGGSLWNGPVDVPIADLRNAGTLNKLNSDLTMRSNNFLTIVDNEARLLDYTAYGPGDGTAFDVPGQLFFWIDTVSVDSVRFWFLRFTMSSTDQIILKDSLRNVVDVVRYGNYVWSDSVAGDPYPNNHSVGPIPEYQSIARYARVGGSYWTGDTRGDFYMTGVQVPNTRPIPQWISQAYK
jgi:hypothetical protein